MSLVYGMPNHHAYGEFPAVVLRLVEMHSTRFEHDCGGSIRDTLIKKDKVS